MPELPEVETIKRGLSKRIVGKTIRDIEIRNAKSFVGDKSLVTGQRILDLGRRAKVLSIKLSNDKYLLFHLKMTGQLIFKHSDFSLQTSVEKKQKSEVRELTADFAGGHPSHDWHAKLPNSTTVLVFDFGDNTHLYFNDLRKFGWCKVLSAKELESIYEKDYGLEPLDKDFTVEYLLRKAKNIPNRNIKQFLMDQTIAAGMGNIYTDEALFDAKISPLRKIKDIKMSEWQQLISSMRKVLALGITHGGTTDSDYVNAEGERGGMQDYLKVYHKTGKPCECGGKVERITIGGRGTHFCPNCQK